MIVDVDVYVDRWPFRRLPGDELPRLVERLAASEVEEAWTGSFDGLFHQDIAGVNARLAADCAKVRPGLLRPFGSVNPALPDWREDLRLCDEEYGMPGIRLHPNYHGYGLDEPVFAELLAEAERRGLVVQLAARVEDPRTHQARMQVPDVDLRPLPKLIASCPKLRLVLLGAPPVIRGEALGELIRAGQVFVEISMLEGIEGVAALLATVPGDRILFGSHFPLFVLESAKGKLAESELPAEQLTAITRGNARRVLPKAT